MERILVIEDSDSISLHIQNELEKAEFSVVICSDYKEIEKKIVQGDYFASIVDMEMGDASWQEIVDLINSHSIPVIIYSSSPYTPELRSELQEKEVLDFISKDRRHSYHDLWEVINRLHLNQAFKIMIVDDSPSARNLARFVLEKTKFTIFEANDGLQALGLLEENPDINVIISDFEMPHMNGYELVKIIREQYDKHRLSIIGFSHPSTKASSATFLKCGANDFISKPYSHEELYCRVLTQVQLLEAFRKVSNLNEQNNNLIGMVSHDIRVPMATIGMVCKQLIEKSGREIPDRVLKGINAISQSSSRTMVLLNDILSITSLEKGKDHLDIEENSLHELVESRLDTFFNSQAEKKKISLVLKSQSLPNSNFDLNRINQVVDNLISNAIKFTPKGGEVIINLKEKREDILFRIWDNGPGLSPFDKEHAFLEFQKLSAKPTGGESSTGLGLAICKKIINMHNGRIWVNSEQGQGAEFCFSLPLTQ